MAAFLEGFVEYHFFERVLVSAAGLQLVSDLAQGTSPAFTYLVHYKQLSGLK